MARWAHCPPLVWPGTGQLRLWHSRKGILFPVPGPQALQ